MANVLALFLLQLLFGFCTCNLQISSADIISVHPGVNITLPCNITYYSEISWYRLRSEELKMLIFAEFWKLDKKYSVTYNVNKSHFAVPESRSSVSLVIIGVRETDEGFYYCGGRERTTLLQFGKPIRLIFTDGQLRDAGNSPDHPDSQISRYPDILSTGAELWITVCVCLVSVLINLIFIFIFCCRLKGKSDFSCSCSEKKEENLHYASIQHKKGSRAAAKNNTASDSDSVIYTSVASQPQRR